MKNLKFTVLIAALFISTNLYSQYKGGSYDGYSSQTDFAIVVSVFENTPLEIIDFQLYQNYPNPFNPSTIISYNIYKTGNVSIRIFDLNGKELATLVDGRQNAGSYEIEFDASDLSAGVYFYRLTAGYFSMTRKMLLIK